MKYLAIGNNAKTIKSDRGGEYLTAIMYLRPSLDLCPMSEKAACIGGCINTAGRGVLPSTQEARQRKSDAFRADPVAFVDQLADDIRIALRKAARKGVKLTVQLNGTSDVAWENMPGSDGRTLLETFPNVQFYDYTKLPNRKVPSNYHLTVSYSAASSAYARKVAGSRHNIAVVFRDRLPATFLGRPVINGDDSDLRFADEECVVVGSSRKVGPSVIAAASWSIPTYSL